MHVGQHETYPAIKLELGQTLDVARFLGNECLHLTSDFPPQVSPGVLRREVPAKRGVCRPGAGGHGPACLAVGVLPVRQGRRRGAGPGRPRDVPGVQRAVAAGLWLVCAVRVAARDRCGG